MPAQITPLSAPPTRADPINFPARADTFLSELPTLAAEMNAAILEINDNALTASAAKDIAILKRNEAVAAASAASDSAASASDSAASASSSAAFASESARLLLGAKSAPPTTDNNGNPLLLGMRYYDTTAGKERVYGNTGWEDGISAVAGVSSFNGMTGAVEIPPASPAEMEAGTEANLRLMSPEGVRTTALAVVSTLSKQSIDYEARTSATPLVSGDATKWISFTSGSFTQTFTDAASLKAGWWAILDNKSSEDITLQPNGAETIDGLSSYVMYPKEIRLVQCDGVALRSIVLKPFYKVATTSGTFIKPPGYSRFGGLLWAGGSSGSKDASYTAGGGGGACAPIDMRSSELSTSTAYIIGAGGAATSTNTKNAGGNSSFGVITAYGGKVSGNGGDALRSFSAQNTLWPILAGADTSTDFFAYYGGGAGNTGVSSPNRGSSVYGGGGGAGINSSLPVARLSTTIYGGLGGESADSTNGQDGFPPGGGGGCTRTGALSGAGARGELRIWGII